MRRWLSEKRLQYLFWVGVTVGGLSFTLWILSFENVVVLFRNHHWIGGLGTIGASIAYLGDLALGPRVGNRRVRSTILYSLILLGGLSWMLLNYRISHIYYFPDTWEYLAVAKYPIVSTDFFQAMRAPTLPLFLKLFGFSGFQSPTPEFLSSARLFTQFQSLFSFVSASTLGLTLAWKISYRPLKPIALLGLMAFGLNTHISMWNKIVYAESLSSSFFFLFVAAFIIADQVSSPRSNHSLATRTLAILFLGVISVLFVLTRDTNAFLVLITAIVVIVDATIEKLFRKRLLGDKIVISLILLGVFLIGSFSAQGGQRWLRPNLNVIHQRILINEDALTFYVEQGLPYLENIAIFDLAWGEFGRAVMDSSEGRDIFTWVQNHGQMTYYSYLLANPVQSFLLPITNADHLLLPDSREYQLLAYTPPEWIPIADAIIYPTSAPILALWTLAVIGGMLYWIINNGWDNRLLIPTILLLTIYPLMFIIYHGDELEIERHALGLAIQLRLSLIMLSFLVLDNLIPQD